MKNTLKYLMLFALILGFAGIASAQTSLTQTTISAAVTVGSVGSPSGLGNTSYQQQVTLASGTGVQNAFNGQPITIIYVDQEAMGILTTVSGTTYNVQRAIFGTKAAPHASGAMVLLQVVSPQFGGYSGSGGLQTADPPQGACLGTNILVTPWVNMQTGNQWICSTATTAGGVWVPGFGNPAEKGLTVAVASAAGATTVSGPYFHITGTNAITSWTVPVGCNATTHGHCTFTVIPDAAFTTTATNNIAVAVTAVANLAQIWMWDSVNSKFTVLQSK